MQTRRRYAYVTGIIFGLCWIITSIQICQAQNLKEDKQSVKWQKETIVKAHVIIASNNSNKKDNILNALDLQSIVKQLKEQFAYKSYRLLKYSIDNGKDKVSKKITDTPTIKIPYAQKGIFYLPDGKIIRIFPYKRDGRLLELEVEVLNGDANSKNDEIIFNTNLWVIDGITFSIGGFPYKDGMLIVALTINPKTSLKDKNTLFAFDSSSLKPLE